LNKKNKMKIKDDINIPYPLYTALVQNPQVKSQIVYSSSSKLNPENNMVNKNNNIFLYLI